MAQPSTGTSRTLVFDIGGSGLRAAVHDPRGGTLGPVLAIEANDHGRPPADALEALIARMDGAARRLLGGRPDAVAVGFPGPVDAEGVAQGAPTVWGGDGRARIPLGARLAALWPGARIAVMNDVTAAGYAQVAAGLRDFLIVNVGSGIGNKLFLDGRPCLGPGSRGGEIGHLQVVAGAGALPCDCGGTGHLGAHASGRGVLAAARRAAALDPDGHAASLPGRQGAGGLDNASLVAAFRAGDAWTGAIIGEAAAHLGRVLACVHLAAGVERFVITGGFALALGDGYRRLVAQGAAAACWPNGFDWDAGVTLSPQSHEANLIGAGLRLQDMKDAP